MQRIYDAFNSLEEAIARQASYKHMPRVYAQCGMHVVKHTKNIIRITEEEFCVSKDIITKVLCDGVSHRDPDHFISMINDISLQELVNG
jgi:hypothetical protein